MQAVLRFAPSPNGRLHSGHAYSALLNESLARKFGGRFLLRMEDIDRTRCNDELMEQMFDDLRWLGLSWGEPVRIQSQHFDDYRRAAQQLKDAGLLYPCFCTRSELAEQKSSRDPDGAPLYTGICKNLTTAQAEARMAGGEPHAWRLDMGNALGTLSTPLAYRRFTLPSMAEETVSANPSRWGDVIILRKETPTSYHLSVVVDDALQGVTHVVRGADLEAATDIHVLLQRLLSLPTPLYHHHKLLLSGDGGKLSKSKESEPLADLRERGITAEEIRRELGL